MARTPLARVVQRAAATQFEDGRRTTRRDLLKGAGAAAVGASLAGSFASPARAGRRDAPSVAVIGAGLAGLTAAYRLQKKGCLADVYEASGRVGGRCYSGRFGDGQIFEHGGELIDTGHKAMRGLARELGLELDDLLRAEQKGTEELGYFAGKRYTVAQMNSDFQPVLTQMAADVAAADYPTLYNSYTQRGYELDHMSVYDYIERYVPGGHHSPLGALLDVAYNIEYGAETTDQSSLNMLYLIGYSSPRAFTIFGESDEKFHIRGGNDQVTTALAAKLAGQLVTNTPLVAIRLQNSGSYRLTFQNGAGSFDKVYDRVVLALPFSILRSSVDYSRAGFNDVKREAIAEQGMGTNSKVNVQFKSRFWRDQGCNGETYSDLGYQNTWEVSRAQPQPAGTLAWYTGGTAGLAVGDDSTESQVRGFLSEVNRVLPGAKAQWNGEAVRDYWPGYQWTKGSYSYWKVGQYTRFVGAEGETSGNCWFCGEHTSIDYQGYLNGAVDTGETAATSLAKTL
ncbi:MAG: FAD-dependent oxidoreductase [Actinobacteria bacterium]|nr:FAD-dependent oxidoreductase [Actinomycetota bacterium]